MVVTKNFAANVDAALKAKHLSQREFAASVGTSYTFLNRIIKGHAAPSLETCERIADALEIPLADMLADPKKFARSFLSVV